MEQNRFLIDATIKPTIIPQDPQKGTQNLMLQQINCYKNDSKKDFIH